MPYLRSVVALALSFICVVTFAQDTSRTYPSKALLEEQIEYHNAQIADLRDQLEEVTQSTREYPHWDLGFGAIFGMDFNRFSNWAGRGEYHNSSSASISTTISASAHLQGENYFLRNNGKVALAWRKLSIDNQEEEAFHNTADLINVNTHLGNKITDKLAMSMLGEWKSNLLDQSLTPSYLDCSVGLTWTPEKDFLAVMHPVNYELVLSETDQFESSMGAKLVLEYDHEVTSGIQIKSHLSGFMSYEDIDFLTNYTWTNGLNIKLLKRIGLGVEYAIRVSPQESLAIASDDDTQSYVVMGVSYLIP